MWNGKGQSEGLFPAWMRQWVGPLLLIALTFPFAFTMVFANTTTYNNNINGSIVELFQQIISTNGRVIIDAFYATWPQGDDMKTVLTILFTYIVFQLILVRIIPGPEHRGPPSPKGHVPVYVNNGLYSFIIAVTVFIVAVLGFEVISAKEILRLYPSLIAVMSVASLFVCALLYLKGVYAPSGPDCETSGNIVLDYYGGRELYPRIFGWDVKQFTNCRFGLMAWGILPIAFVAGTVQSGEPITNGQIVNLLLQLVYLAKFYEWECGYFNTMDIMHDKAGYYICWGCLVWVPSVYVVHSHYIAQQILAHTYTDMSNSMAIIVAIVGLLSVWINYDIDLQRQYVRATDAKCLVWGEPAKVIRTKFTVDGSKEEKSSILLVSGWWGVARHFHYVPELLAALCWSLPAGFNHFLPYFYFFFLLILLVDRAYRDDVRCAQKYGKYWSEYCKAVPYKIIPGVI